MSDWLVTAVQGFNSLLTWTIMPKVKSPKTWIKKSLKVKVELNLKYYHCNLLALS